jgi:hypothetical protein
MQVIIRQLQRLAKVVLAMKRRLVEKVTKSRKIEIIVILEAGVVQEITNLPPNLNVTVVDYDTDGVENERLEISPVDGELCVINQW